MPISAEAAVLFSPSSTFQRKVKAPPGGRWYARPLVALLILGCAVSLMTAGRLTLRLLLPAMLYASFVPGLQMASMAVVCRGDLPFRRAVDLFFIGHAPWSIWLLASTPVWGLLPAATAYSHASAWHASAVAALLWSAHIDYWFFRRVLGRTPRAAARDLLLQRLMCWIPGLLIFVAPAGWQVVASALGV